MSPWNEFNRVGANRVWKYRNAKRSGTGADRVNSAGLRLSFPRHPRRFSVNVKLHSYSSILSSSSPNRT